MCTAPCICISYYCIKYVVTRCPVSGQSHHRDASVLQWVLHCKHRDRQGITGQQRESFQEYLGHACAVSAELLRSWVLCARLCLSIEGRTTPHTQALQYRATATGASVFQAMKLKTNCLCPTIRTGLGYLYELPENVVALATNDTCETQWTLGAPIQLTLAGALVTVPTASPPLLGSSVASGNRCYGDRSCACEQRSNMAEQSGMEQLDIGALSPEQQAKLRKFKIKTRIENEKYLRSHPEVDLLLSGFLREVFLKRPEDIREFAAALSHPSGADLRSWAPRYCLGVGCSPSSALNDRAELIVSSPGTACMLFKRVRLFVQLQGVLDWTSWWILTLQASVCAPLSHIMCLYKPTGKPDRMMLEMPEYKMTNCTGKGQGVPMVQSLNKTVLGINDTTNPMSHFLKLLQILSPGRTPVLSYTDNSTWTPLLLMSMHWNVTQALMNCSDIFHFLSMMRNVTVSAPPGGLECLLRAFIAPVSWDMLAGNGSGLSPDQFRLLLWGSQPLLLEPRANLSLPSQLPRQHLELMMGMFHDVFESLSPDMRNDVLKWIRPRLVQSFFNCSLDRSTPKLGTAKGPSSRSKFLFLGLSGVIQISTVYNFCQFFQSPKFPDSFTGTGPLNPEVGRRLLEQLRSHCLNTSQNSDDLTRLGSLTCFYDDLQPPSDSVSQKILSHLQVCNNSRIDKVKQLLVKKVLGSGPVTQQVLQSLGSVASSLSVSQLSNLNLSSIRDSLSSLGAVRWNPAQAKALANKLMQDVKVSVSQYPSLSLTPLSHTVSPQSLSELTPSVLQSMGSVIRGLGSKLLRSVKGGDELLRTGQLDRLSRDMSTLQRAAVLEGVSPQTCRDPLLYKHPNHTQLKSSPDLRNVSKAVLVRTLSGPLISSLSLDVLQQANLSSVDDLQGKPWTRAQELYSDKRVAELVWLRLSSALLVRNILGSKLNLQDIKKLGQAVQGVTCTMIDSVSNSSVQETTNTLVQSEAWLSKSQVSCIAKKLFSYLGNLRQNYFSNISDSELRAIPTLILLHLPPEKLASLPPAVCSQFLEKVAQINLTAIPHSSLTRPALRDRALACLGKNVTSLTGQDVLKLGPLLCELGPQNLSLLSQEALNASLSTLAQCRQLNASRREALFGRIQSIYGDPSTWTSSMMATLGPFLLLNDTALRSLPSKSWLKTTLLDLLDTLPAPPSGPTATEYSSQLNLTALRWKLYSLITAPPGSMRKRRAVSSTPTLQQILELGDSNVFWTPEQLASMTPETFKDGLSTLGTVKGFSVEQLAALRNKSVQAWGVPSSLTAEHLLQLGCLAQGFSPSELRSLNLSVDTVEALSTCNWTQAQREAVLQGFLEQTHASAGALGALELVGLGQFVCGMTPEQVSQINTASYRGAARVLGSAECPLAVNERLKDKAVAVYGDMKTWTEAVVSEVGNVMGQSAPMLSGLSASELQVLVSSVLPFISASAIPLIPPERLANVSATQLQALGPDNAAMVTEAQKSAMNDLQKKALADVLGVQFTPRAQTTTTPATVTPLPQKAGGSGSDCRREMEAKGSQAAALLGLCWISVALRGVAPSASGECYFNARASCEHKGQVFGIGETWLTKDCYQCICLNPFGVGCCDQGQQPIDFPDWCEAIQRPDSCSVAVVMRANHKIPCIDRGSRGRRRGGAAWKTDNDPLF
ncbi:OTOAN protein, partial [Atractosteus spatula]|nr:OTOAN protein [Atractosteus spatula]